MKRGAIKAFGTLAAVLAEGENNKRCVLIRNNACMPANGKNS